MAKHNTLDLLGESVTTTDATVTTLSSFQTVPGKAYEVFARVVGLNTDYTQGAGYERSASFRTVAAGTLSQVGSTAATVTNEDNAAWDCEIVGSGTTIIVRVTGANGATINWRADVNILVVGTGPENS